MAASDSADDATFSTSPGFVFDTETTGVEALEDRVVELGGLCFVNGKESAERRMRIDPQRPIPAGASAVHGIYDADLKGKPTFAQIADRFAMYLDGRMHGGVSPWLVGYNACSFDAPLLNAEFRRAGLAITIDAQRVVDPMIFVRWHLRHLRKRSLESVCLHYGIDSGRAHSALDDARATGTLLFRLLSEGLMPQRVSEALAEQKRIQPILDAEWQEFAYWLYRDRHDGQFRLGAGGHIGALLTEVSPDYLRSLLTKISDLPEQVRANFLACASHEVIPLQKAALAL